MSHEYIITMTAANRVGILAAVTKAMVELDADLREASQTVVRGYFTMIFSAEFPDHLEAGVIQDHLQDACRPFGIAVTLQKVTDTTVSETQSVAVKLYTLRVGGDNRRGVMRELSSVISMRRIDITGMRAVRTRNGEGFEMVMKIAVPMEFDVGGFLNELNGAGQSFNITANISDVSY
jgi:predicted amino acid-binding ACT domain protein